jgi:Aldo/keto reductase family
VLTGKYTRVDDSLDDSRRAAANQHRLTDRNLAIARTVDGIADETGCTSGQIAAAWLRHREPRVIPVNGIRTRGQLDDLLGTSDVFLGADHMARLNRVSAIEPGVPNNLLGSPQGQLVYGDLEVDIDLPDSTPYRSAQLEALRAPSTRVGNLEG